MGLNEFEEPAAGQAQAGEGLAAPSAGTAVAGAPTVSGGDAAKAAPSDPFVRAENEDDDGYDPYSDRPAPREPMFERDPWG